LEIFNLDLIKLQSWVEYMNEEVGCKIVHVCSYRVTRFIHSEHPYDSFVAAIFTAVEIFAA